MHGSGASGRNAGTRAIAAGMQSRVCIKLSPLTGETTLGRGALRRLIRECFQGLARLRVREESFACRTWEAGVSAAGSSLDPISFRPAGAENGGVLSGLVA